MNLALAGIVLFVALQLAIGVAVSRRVRSGEDFMIAGRRLGYGLAVFSIFATWFGSETCIGAAGEIYRRGFSGGAADPFGYSLCLGLMGVVFASALWRRRVVTIGDLFRERFSPWAERLVVFITVPASLLWAAAQVRAFAQVLATASGLEVAAAITVATAVVVTYTAFGGLLADAATDVVQGLTLAVALVALGVAALVALGGPAGAAAAVEPARLDPIGAPGAPPLDVLEAWLVPILGSVTAQELIARVVATRTPQVARRATLIAALLYLAIGLVPACLGLVGPALLPGLDDPERLIPVLAREHLGGVGYMLFSGALVSAILSTVDSNLLAISSLTAHNVVFRLRPAMSERARLRVLRALVAAAGVTAGALALSSKGVYQLVESASAFGGAGFFVAMLLGVHTRFGGPHAGLAALVTGMTVQLGGAYVAGWSHPFTISLGASAAAYVLVGAWEAWRRSRLDSRRHSP